MFLINDRKNERNLSNKERIFKKMYYFQYLSKKEVHKLGYVNESLL